MCKFNDIGEQVQFVFVIAIWHIILLLLPFKMASTKPVNQSTNQLKPTNQSHQTENIREELASFLFKLTQKPKYTCTHTHTHTG